MVSIELIYTGFIFSISLFSYYLQKKSKSRLVDVFLVLIGIIISINFIENSIDLFFFLFGLIFGYINDLIAVYVKMWSYETKNGYSYWVGTGWALLFLFIYKSKNITLIETLPILIISILVAIKYSKTIIPTEKYQYFAYFVKLLAILLNPTFFLYVFSMGLLIEFIAVDLFKVWKYEALEYFRIGTSYALFFIYPERIIEYYITKTTTPTLFQNMILIVISFYFISLLFYSHAFKNRKHKNIKKITNTKNS